MTDKAEASLKKQEEDVDSSLALLERLQTHAPVHEKPWPELRIARPSIYIDNDSMNNNNIHQIILHTMIIRMAMIIYGLFCMRSKRRSPKKGKRHHRHLSRSKSISAASVTSSDERDKRSRAKKRTPKT